MLHIEFFGTPGSGKSTLANALEQCLCSMGYRATHWGDHRTTNLSTDLLARPAGSAGAAMRGLPRLARWTPTLLSWSHILLAKPSTAGLRHRLARAPCLVKEVIKRTLLVQDPRYDVVIFNQNVLQTLSSFIDEQYEIPLESIGRFLKPLVSDSVGVTASIFVYVRCESATALRRVRGRERGWRYGARRNDERLLREVYPKIRGFCDTCYAALPPASRFCLCSDHSRAPAQDAFQLCQRLRREGHLSDAAAAELRYGGAAP